MNHWTIVSIAALALLAGCGHSTPTSLSGTYGPPGDPNDAMTFHSDGTVQWNRGGLITSSKYSIHDGKVVITLPGGQGVELKIDSNGCLYSDAAGTDPSKKVCKR